MASQTKVKLQALGILVFVFVLGVTTGAAITSRMPAQAQPAPPPTASFVKDENAYFQQLERELQLNTNQATAIRGILNRTGQQYSLVCAEVRPRYDALRNETRASVRALLSGEQKVKFDQLVVQENCSTCPINVIQ